MPPATPEGLPPTPGAYALRSELIAPAWVSVGRLGTFRFPSGQYLYLGSAQGSGGVRARVLHHLYPRAVSHWHLDWLRTYLSVMGCWFASPGASALECYWSQALAALPGASVPAAGFGASDCRFSCPAHLVRLPEKASFLSLSEILQSVSPEQLGYADLRSGNSAQISP